MADRLLALLARLQRDVEVLGWDADAQLSYLHGLGLSGLMDELALQFEDSFVIVPELRRHGLVSAEAERLLLELDAQLDRMSPGTADLWLEEGLRSAPEWEAVRRLARRALPSLARPSASVRDGEVGPAR